MTESIRAYRCAYSNRGRWLAIAAMLGALLRPAAQAQAAPSRLPTTTLDQLPKAIDDAVSGPGNKTVHDCGRC